MTTKFLLLIFTLLWLGGGAMAQQRYSLQQCLEFAVHNSYDAHRAQLDLQQAAYQRHEALAGMLPQVNAGGSLDNNLVLGSVMLPGEIVGQPGTTIAAQMGTKYALDASASLEQVVFAPSLFVGIKIAKNNHELQQLRSTMTRREIIFAVGYAFYDILNTMQELEHLDYILLRQDSLHTLMRARVAENLTREVDANRLLVNLTNLRLRRANAANTLAQQKRYLQLLIGMPLEARFELDGAEALSALAGVPQSEGEAPRKLELDILAKQRDILDLEIRQQRAGYLPTLSAVASGGYQFQAESLDFAHEPWLNSCLVGVRLSVPVFDGLGKRSRLRQKRVQQQQLDVDTRQTAATLTADHHNATAQLALIRTSVEAQAENLQLAERIYLQTVLLYTEGLAGVSDLLETETSLREAKIAHSAEIIRYRKTEIDLLKANGMLEKLL